MAGEARFRLYIDEVGNSDLGASSDPNHRYLSLTGVIANLDYVNDVVHPKLESLKHRYFGHHVDNDVPIVLHRKELLHCKHPFESLRDPEVHTQFDRELLTLIEELEYAVITVVIDKKEHVDRYVFWREHPYHYCLDIMVERYVRWLERKGGCGDVMAESRGRRDDEQLKRAFLRLYLHGTYYVGHQHISKVLTSKELKLKRKQANIAGLQLADILAHPSFASFLHSRKREDPSETFGEKIAEILVKSKYDRNPTSGKMDGWGRKWLP